MPAINTDEAIRARKAICEDTVHAIAKFLAHIDSDEKLLEVLCMSCVANKEGGASFDDIKRTHDWFHDAVKRLHLLQGQLQGHYSVEVSEAGEASICLSDLALSLSPEQDADVLWSEIENREGWLGLWESESSSQLSDGGQ